MLRRGASLSEVLSDRSLLLLSVSLTFIVGIVIGVVIIPAALVFLLLGIAGEAGSLTSLQSIGIGLACCAIGLPLGKLVSRLIRSIHEIEARLVSKAPYLAVRIFVFLVCPSAFFTFLCQVVQASSPLGNLAFGGCLAASFICAHLWRKTI